MRFKVVMGKRQFGILEAYASEYWEACLKILRDHRC